MQSFPTTFAISRKNKCLENIGFIRVEGCTETNPGIPKNGKWKVRWEVEEIFLSFFFKEHKFYKKNWHNQFLHQSSC